MSNKLKLINYDEAYFGSRRDLKSIKNRKRKYDPNAEDESDSDDEDSEEVKKKKDTAVRNDGSRRGIGDDYENADRTFSDRSVVDRKKADGERPDLNGRKPDDEAGLRRTPGSYKKRSPAQKLKDAQEGQRDRRERLRDLARDSFEYSTRSKSRIGRR